MTDANSLLPYSRGALLTSTADDIAKVMRAWDHLADKLRSDPGSVYNLSGLERGLPIKPEDIPNCDDERAPALWMSELQELGLAHLGGDPDKHDVFVANRLTAALVAANLTMLSPGDRVVGVSARFSHPAVIRAAIRAGATFDDSRGLEGFRRALDSGPAPAMVSLTRLTVSYELLAISEIEKIISLARDVGAKVLVDDAGGARVGPAIFDQPKLIDLGVDVGATGLDKYGTIGPRVGLLGGEASLVHKIRATAFELGLEARPMLYPAIVRSLRQYDPDRVKELVASTMTVADALEQRIGKQYVFRTPVTVQIRGESTLEWLAAAGFDIDDSIVPYEATAALAMLLLRDHGILSVHFAGIPPGTSALLLKFVPPETLSRLGGPTVFADHIFAALDSLGGIIGDAATVKHLLLGETG